jgi:rhodanese-related sulfurtransferase
LFILKNGAQINHNDEGSKMAIKQLEPRAAHKFLSETPGAVYLDVRTEAEFAQGHPAGAINVPVVFIKGPGQMEPNPEFVDVVKANLPKETPLVVGCMMGGRSQRACEILEKEGYQTLVNVRGGYGGARDASGAVAVAGWRDEGLPVSSDVSSENSYAALRSKTVRR